MTDLWKRVQPQGTTSPRHTTRLPVAVCRVHGVRLRWETGRRRTGSRLLLCPSVSRGWHAVVALEDVYLIPLRECECVTERQTDRHLAWI